MTAAAVSPAGADDLWRAGIRVIAGEVRAGTLTAREVVMRALARMDIRNGGLGAIVARADALALAQADEIDRRVRAGEDPGPLAGIPFSVKDIIATDGLPTTAGGHVLDEVELGVEAPQVTRLRTAGAIVVGKSNCPELAIGVHTINERYGLTANPTGSHTVGGSSGGDAAAVASGMTAFGLGTDFGGSIRWPASCTGLYGWRPEAEDPDAHHAAAGQLPVSRGVELCPFQAEVQVVGTLTRDLDDAEMLFGVLSPGPALPAADELVFFDRLDLLDVSSGVVDALAALAVRARRAGFRVRTESGAILAALEANYSELRRADSLSRLIDERAGGVGRLSAATARVVAEAEASASQSMQAAADRRRLLVEFDRMLPSDSVAVLPISIAPPTDYAPSIEQDLSILAPARAISSTGLASFAVPTMPLPVQLVASRGESARLFATVRRLQQGRAFDAGS
ncbi:amidase [Microbacterium sp.]|uniref:amidase n=1 Tax=Microbacterium sp. TaxID=51671 RepID=UPI003A92E596